MSLTVPSVLCCAAVLQRPDGAVLLVQRTFHKSMGGMWEFPGGKVEPFETPQETIVRELFEEIGITATFENISPFTFVSHTYEHFHLNMFVFLCNIWTGDVVLKEGQPDCVWVQPPDLENYLVPSADEPIIKRLIIEMKH
jgi:8-oxo-dGTP diphosphatase